MNMKNQRPSNLPKFTENKPHIIEENYQICCCEPVCCSITGETGVLDIIVTILWLITPIFTTISLIIMCIGVITDQWLHTEERMSFYNGTGERIYLSKYTVSGLWTLCYTNPGEHDRYCFNIDYFPSEEYSPDPNDSTLAIPYAVTKSAAFYLLATIFLFIAEFCSCFGHFARHRRFFTFLSGIIFILAGLMVLIGLVMYISVFKAEVGSKLRPRSTLQPPLFTYRYGYSFILVVCAFILTEMAGTCSVFLYIYSHQLEWKYKYRSDESSAILLQVPPPPHLSKIRKCEKHHDNQIHSPLSNRIRNHHYYSTMPRNINNYSLPIVARSHSQGNLTRDTTCNTISTTVDIISNSSNSHHDFNMCRDTFSFDSLRKTTPV